MVKINIEIRESKEGFILEDNYEQEEVFFKTFDKAVDEANKRFTRFKEIELTTENN